MEEVILKLKQHMDARYPLFLMLSHEERRVWRQLGFFAEDEGLELWRWRATVGLEGPKGVVDDTRSPVKAIAYFLKHRYPSLLVFWGLESYFSNSEVIRALRDLCLEVGAKRQSVVIQSPTLKIPEELEKSLAVLDVPLPSVEEGQMLLDVVCRSQSITISKDLFNRFVYGSLGLTEEEIKRLYSRILQSGERFSESDLKLQIQEKRKAIHRSKYLEFWDIHSLSLSVGGLDNLKFWLEERALAFTDAARAYGLPEPKGLFLLGVQGCGKSLMAKAVAQMWKLPLLRLDVGALFSAGSAEEGFRQTIRVAESMAPVILWIDELEKGFAQAQQQSADSLGYFLTWMQEKKKMVFVVATANEVRKLPPELLRKGRFDEIFFVDLPDVHERLEILDIHVKQRQRKPEDYSLDLVAEETERFSGAELEQVVISAMYKAFADRREFDTEDLLEASREFVPLAVTMDDQLKDLREWARPRARRATADRRRVDFFDDWGE